MWGLDHQLVQFNADHNLHGILELELNEKVPFRDMRDFLYSFPAAQDGYDNRGRPWTSASWVLRAIEMLEDAGLVSLPVMTHELNLHVELQGARLETMKDEWSPRSEHPVIVLRL
jgi:hypothetical protein